MQAQLTVRHATALTMYGLANAHCHLLVIPAVQEKLGGSNVGLGFTPKGDPAINTCHSLFEGHLGATVANGSHCIQQPVR